MALEKNRWKGFLSYLPSVRAKKFSLCFSSWLSAFQLITSENKKDVFWQKKAKEENGNENEGGDDDRRNRSSEANTEKDAAVKWKWKSTQNIPTRFNEWKDGREELKWKWNSWCTSLSLSFTLSYPRPPTHLHAHPLTYTHTHTPTRTHKATQTHNHKCTQEHNH